MILPTCIIALIVVVAVRSGQFKSDVYPSHVPKYSIRLDQHTGRPVQSGLMHLLPNRSTLNDFRRHLQCSKYEPNSNFNGGLISRLRSKPLTTNHLKYLCAYIEEHCNERFWPLEKCKRHDFEKYLNGSYYQPFKGFTRYTPYALAYLLRVLDGQLYYDWPWGIDRLKEEFTTNPLIPLLHLTLKRITDMRDSVFFVGGADPNIPLKIDMPMFSYCTEDKFAELIFPWRDMWVVETTKYRELRQANLDFNETNYQLSEPGYRPWNERVPKAALFTKYLANRQFILDVARQHQELIDARSHYRFCITPWHPLSREKCKYYGVPDNFQFPSEQQIRESQSLPPGYAFPLFNVSSPVSVSYQPGAYKYVIVPLGQNEFLSTSSRMSHLLAYSGAVILTPRSSLKFHFSAQLKPWVHYVPLSFTGADLAEKVQWLREHDDMARQIAENGRAFARSYLRLEDYYCYAAQVLEMMSELTSNNRTSVARDVFSPQKIAPFTNPWDYEFE